MKHIDLNQEDFSLKVGSYLKKLRTSKNISQQALADYVGIHRITVTKIEQGQNITLFTFMRIMKALGELSQFDFILKTQSENTGIDKSGVEPEPASTTNIEDQGVEWM